MALLNNISSNSLLPLPSSLIILFSPRCLPKNALYYVPPRPPNPKANPELRLLNPGPTQGEGGGSHRQNLILLQKISLTCRKMIKKQNFRIFFAMKRLITSFYPYHQARRKGWRKDWVRFLDWKLTISVKLWGSGCPDILRDQMCS